MSSVVAHEVVHDNAPGGRDNGDVYRKNAIAKMRSPYEMEIICIDVTNKCDLACSNCTRLLENQDTFWDMTPENFRLALRSMEGFPGIVAVIGGNPAMHKNFKELCAIITEEFPDKRQRGLWTNNVFKHTDLAAETFGVFNLNTHGSDRGVKSLIALRELGWYHEGYSTHSPLLTAGKDLFDEEEMWDRISKCDVNQNWSATLIQNKGKLRAYFCEVAASFDLARGTDFGVDPVPGWWRRHVSEFEDQITRFCPGCGVPAKLKGHMDVEEIDTYTASNADLALKSHKNKHRTIVEVTRGQKLATTEFKVTDYSDRCKKPYRKKWRRRFRQSVKAARFYLQSLFSR
jgi:hypothetical protein